VIADIQSIYCFRKKTRRKKKKNKKEKKKKKEVRKNELFNVNKAKCPSQGGMDSLNTFLTDTLLRRNETVNNLPVWTDGS